MICERCRTSNEKYPGPHGLRARREPLYGDPLPMPLCTSCGTLVSASDPLQTMLSKLAQLARFGLDSEGRPLLEPAKGDR